MSEILTAEQLADRWQVKVDWVYAKCREGRLPCIPLPGKYRRFRLDTIEAFERGELAVGGEEAYGGADTSNGRAAPARRPPARP